jgi:hypothetical protein
VLAMPQRTYEEGGVMRRCKTNNGFAGVKLGGHRGCDTLAPLDIRTVLHASGFTHGFCEGAN